VSGSGRGEDDVDPLAVDPVAVAPPQARQAPPDSGVLQAFRASPDDLRRLPGGQQTAWTDGRVVLKPVGFAPEHAWVCDVYEGWTAHDRIRVPEPVRPQPASAGVDEDSWTADGWAAHVFVAGRDADLAAELERVREANDLFHEAIADLQPPAFLAERSDPWAFGDRLAWEDAEAQGGARTRALVARLREALEPVTSRAQLIHGDILPNVLLAPGRAPAVIDWPPYHRPAAFARAIAVTDAVTFRGASPQLFETWESGPDWDQLLLRAVLYRLGPTGFFEVRNRLMGSLTTHVERAEPVVDALLRRRR
jgi:uncharacterized protein (TIGR02569 family)